jgi:hypothetical protein
LVHGVRAAIPQASPLATAEFTTIRERLIKIGARVIEHIARIRIQLPTSCPEGLLFAPSRSASCRLAHEPRGDVPRPVADHGRPTPYALHRALLHTDPAGSNGGSCQLASGQKSAA